MKTNYDMIHDAGPEALVDLIIGKPCEYCAADGNYDMDECPYNCRKCIEMYLMSKAEEE